jgi:hypothetical protein
MFTFKDTKSTARNSSDDPEKDTTGEKICIVDAAAGKAYFDSIMLLELSVAKALFNERPEILWEENQLTYTDSLISDVRGDLVQLAAELGRNEWQIGVVSAQVRMPLLDSLFEDVNRHLLLLKASSGRDEFLVTDCEALQRIWNEGRAVIESDLQSAAREPSSRSPAKEELGSVADSSQPDFTPLELKAQSPFDSYAESLQSYVGLTAQRLSAWYARKTALSERCFQARSEVETAWTQLHDDLGRLLDPENRLGDTLYREQLRTIQAECREKLGSFLENATETVTFADFVTNVAEEKSLATLNSDSSAPVSSFELPERKRKYQDIS